MAGILYRKSTKWAILLLLLLLLGGLFVFFATPAQAVPVSIQLNQQPGFYEIMNVNNVAVDGDGKPIPIAFTVDYVNWDTNPEQVASPTDPQTGPFRFALVYDKTKFNRAVTVMQASSSSEVRQVDQTALFTRFGRTERYPVYEIDRMDSNITLSAYLYCNITLMTKFGLSDVSISSTQSREVQHNAAFTFTVTTKELFTPKVHQYLYPKHPNDPDPDYEHPNPDDPLHHSPDSVLTYTTVDTSQVGIDKTYRYTYTIDKVAGNTTIYVANVMDAYVVQMPVADSTIYQTDVGSGIHVTEYYETDPITGVQTTTPPTKKPFPFVMQFTAKYATSEPHASVSDDSSLIVVDESRGNRTFLVTVPPPAVKKSLTIAFNDKLWYIVLNGITIQKNPSYYMVNPEDAYLQVEYDSPGTFYLIPTPAYAHNTKPPTFNVTSGYSVTAVSEGSQWKCTIVGLKHTVDVTVNVSLWTIDPNAPTGDVSLITMPVGTGYSIGNILGGYGIGNNQYRVNNGDDFIFSVNVATGYDPSSLNVSVAGQRLFPENGVYTIPKVNASLAVAITVDALSTSTPTPSPGSSPGSSPGKSPGGNGEDDGTELKYREVYDEKSGVSIAGFFVGIPEIVVTELLKTDPVYMRMQSTANVADDKILRAVDVQIKNATAYGTITLGLQVGAGYNTIEMLVVHATSMGDETYTVLGQDGMATVAVRHTSPFMVADPYGRGTGSSNGNGSNGGINGGSILPPATGGARSIMGFLLIAVVICSVLFIIWYRWRDPKPEEAEASTSKK